MSLLSQVTTGRVARPGLVLVYGPDGVGKTSLAAGAPSPLFLGAESGTNHLDVARLGIHSLKQFSDTLSELATSTHAYKTLVLDTADWLDASVQQHVIATHGKADYKSIEDFGFGKGRVHVYETWRTLLGSFNACRDSGMEIIILAHSMVKKFEDPSTPQGYERYQLKLQSGAGSDVAALLREYVDSVLFMNYEVFTASGDKKRAFGDGSAVLHTQRMPSFDAKNRFGLPAQIALPRCTDVKLAPAAMWGAYQTALAKAMATPSTDTTELEAEVARLLEQVTDAKLRSAAAPQVAKAKGNAAELNRLKSKLTPLVSKGKEKASVPVGSDVRGVE